MCAVGAVFSETVKSQRAYGADDDSVMLTGRFTVRECGRCSFRFTDKVYEQQMARTVEKYKRVLLGQSVAEKDKRLNSLASQVLRLKAQIRFLTREK